MDVIERRVHARWKRLGYSELLPEERGYVAAWWLVVDVNNGGFHQYLTNNTADVALIALEALQQAGATETYTILKQALTILEGVGGYSADRRTREDRIKALPQEGAEFDALDQRFYESSEQFLTPILIRVEGAYRTHGIGA